MTTTDAFDFAAIPTSVLEQIERRLIAHRDFHLGSYKDSYVKRRIAIRIRANRCSTAEEYLHLLLREETELDLLLNALNIHVSQFFRNPSTFDKVRNHALPELFSLLDLEGRERLLVWSVGCAGGEEPYTIALMMHHFFPRQVKEGRVAIVASDVDAGILDTARTGSYRAERLSEVPEELREKYFRREGDCYRLTQEVRNMVTFRQGDLFHPDAFIESDLIICRNVLIYFEQWQQARILNRFSEVLRSGGFLVLGRSETLCREPRRNFETVCPSERIYRRL